MKQRPRRIGLILFEGITALDLVGPADAFGSARVGPEGSPRPAYELVVLGVSRRACRSETGLRLTPDRTLEDAPALDTLIVPGGSGLREPSTTRAVASFVRARARTVRRIAAVCTGIYGLAPTGLLDGRRVTTHWAFADDVARKYPKVIMSPDALFVKDGRFYTAAGVTSGIDLSLSLIEEDLGPARALAVAREMVVYMKRAGGQRQFSEPLRFQVETRERLRDLSDYVVTHLAGDLSVSALAKAFALSGRQLSRLCQRELGQSPAALVQRLRLEDARRRLLEAGASVDAVSASVGFGSADAFRRAFEKSYGVNPSSYRLRFRATRERARRAVAR
jgi:transcriptional regulator GlxA family with amidase domain